MKKFQVMTRQVLIVPIEVEAENENEARHLVEEELEGVEKMENTEFVRYEGSFSGFEVIEV